MRSTAALRSAYVGSHRRGGWSGQNISLSDPTPVCSPYGSTQPAKYDVIVSEPSFVGRNRVTTQVVAWPQLHEDARRLSEWMHTCDGPTPSLESIIRMAQLLVPEPTGAELDAIWRSIESACGGSLTPRGREWLAFFTAAGRRDGAGMSMEARRLLAGDPFLTEALKRYLVAAAMLGSISVGNRSEARDLWAQNSNSIGRTDDLLFDVLRAQGGE